MLPRKHLVRSCKIHLMRFDATRPPMLFRLAGRIIPDQAILQTPVRCLVHTPARPAISAALSALPALPAICPCLPARPGWLAALLSARRAHRASVGRVAQC